MGEALTKDALGSDPAAKVSFRDTNLYDALTRAPLMAWFALTGLAMLHHLVSDLSEAAEITASVLMSATAHAAGLLFVLFVLGALLGRRRPLARMPGLWPRLSAIAGAFSITALGLLPKAALPPALAALSVALMLLGYGLSCYAIRHLGRALSLMPEARRLVTTGPYAVVRHPLYVAEAIASCGLLLQFRSATALLLWVVHIGFQLARMRCEERIMRDTFPEYATYARRVPRLLPRLWPSLSAGARQGRALR